MVGYYFSAVEFIRNENFPMYVPAFYHPYMNADMLDPLPFERQKPNKFGPTPMYGHPVRRFDHVDDPHTPQLASYSVEVMVDMVSKGISFQFINEEDVVHVFDGIDRYLLSVKHDVDAGDSRVIAYVKQMLDLRKEMYKLYFRYMKMHPAAEAALYPANNPKGTIIHLMQEMALGDVNISALDPVKCRENPPYPIMTASKVTKTSSGPSVESYLPDEYHAPKTDDGDDFNFTEFLNRK